MAQQPPDTWQLHEAKAKLSAVIRAAEKRPQTITVGGKKEFFLLSREHIDSLQGTKKKRKNQLLDVGLGTLLRNSPLYGLDIDWDNLRDRRPTKKKSVFDE